MDAETTVRKDRNASNPEFVEHVAELNVLHVLKEIPKQSPIIESMVKDGDIVLIGGMYNVDTGMVEFYEDQIVNTETLEESLIESSQK